MNVKTDHSGSVAIVRVGETRLMYPILSDFSTAVSGLVAGGNRDNSKCGQPMLSRSSDLARWSTCGLSALDDHLNAVNPSAIFAANRATGRIALEVSADGNRTRRAHVCEQNSLRVRFPNAAPSP
jgi:hypothetical protein